MTLNDLERHNSPYFAFFSLNLIALLANYVTVVEDRPKMSVKYCLPVPIFYFWPYLIHPAACLSAMAELLVFMVLGQFRG